jgi:hypothetical protein
MIHTRTFCSYDFLLHWKATTTTTTDEIFGGKQMQMLVYVQVLIPALVHRAQIS